MKQITALCAVAVFLCCLPSARAEGESSLSFQEAPPQSPLILYSCQSVKGTAQKPSQLKRSPEGLSPDVLYFAARAGDKPLLMALDWSREPKLYVDSNLNADLSEESPLKGRTGETGKPQFGLCRVKVDGREIKFWAVAASQKQLFLCHTGFMSGRVQVQGQNLAVALMDSNFDGRYDVPILLPISLPMVETWDTIALDASGDGQFQSYDEVWPITKLTKIQDAFYEVEVRADGSKISLKAATPPMGSLDVEFPDAEVELWSDACCQAVSGSGGKWQLPAGRYRANTWAIHRSDAEGNKWTLKSGSTGGKLNDFTIPIGGTASIALGPPLALRTTSRREGDMVSLQLLLVGQSEEAYALVVEKGDKPMTPPKVKILDESGRTLASGDCECDEHNNYSFSWRVPEGFKGEPRQEIECFLGPFELRPR